MSKTRHLNSFYISCVTDIYVGSLRCEQNYNTVYACGFNATKATYSQVNNTEYLAAIINVQKLGPERSLTVKVIKKMNKCLESLMSVLYKKKRLHKAKDYLK